MNLQPYSTSTSSIAELSRPDRFQNSYIKQKGKKPQGRKRKRESKSATYTNWHAPFLWSQIELAAKRVGWRMSPSAIRNELQKINSETFAKLSRTTIQGWIDQSGEIPHWSDAALRMAKSGNHTGLDNRGGRRGILVCYC